MIFATMVQLYKYTWLARGMTVYTDGNGEIDEIKEPNLLQCSANGWFPSTSFYILLRLLLPTQFPWALFLRPCFSSSFLCYFTSWRSYLRNQSFQIRLPCCIFAYGTYQMETLVNFLLKNHTRDCIKTSTQYAQSNPLSLSLHLGIRPTSSFCVIQSPTYQTD